MSSRIPHISEKSMKCVKLNTYLLEIPTYYTKKDIVEFIKNKYKIRPLSVRTINRTSVRKKRGKSIIKLRKFTYIKMPKDKKIVGFEVEKWKNYL